MVGLHRLFCELLAPPTLFILALHTFLCSHKGISFSHFFLFVWSPFLAWRQTQYSGGLNTKNYVVIQDGGRLFGFGMIFKIKTIQHSNNFRPFKITLELQHPKEKVNISFFFVKKTKKLILSHLIFLFIKGSISDV